MFVVKVRDWSESVRDHGTLDERRCPWLLKSCLSDILADMAEASEVRPRGSQPCPLGTVFGALLLRGLAPGTRMMAVRGYCIPNSLARTRSRSPATSEDSCITVIPVSLDASVASAFAGETTFSWQAHIINTSSSLILFRSQLGSRASDLTLRCACSRYFDSFVIVFF